MSLDIRPPAHRTEANKTRRRPLASGIRESQFSHPSFRPSRSGVVDLFRPPATGSQPTVAVSKFQQNPNASLSAWNACPPLEESARSVKRGLWHSILGFTLLLSLAVGLFFLTDLRVDDIFFWVFAFWIFWWNRDARISIAMALAGLVAIPMLLELERRDRILFADGEAETVAVWVYFFLVIGVAKQIWDMRRRQTTDN